MPELGQELALELLLLLCLAGSLVGLRPLQEPEQELVQVDQHRLDSLRLLVLH